MSTTPNRILVTGATGTIGRSLVAELRSKVTVRAYSRNAASAGPGEGIEIVEGDLGDVAAFEQALKGVDAVFLLWPFLPVAQARPLVDAVARHDVPMVYLSAASAGDPSECAANPITRSHFEIEQLIEASVSDWAIVRPTAFATNTLFYWAGQIKAAGAVQWPLPATRLAVIHEGDIAAVIAQVLLNGSYGGRKLLVTGPATLTPVEQLVAISQAIGRPLAYEELSVDVARAQMLGWGLPADIADGVLGYWSRRVSDPEPVTDTVSAVTGRSATSFQDWAIENAGRFA